MDFEFDQEKFKLLLAKKKPPLTQQELGIKLGLTPASAGSTVSNWVRGHRRAPEAKLERIEETLGVSRDKFGKQPKKVKVTLTLSELYDLYDKLSKGSTVSIVSADGFKEIDDWDLRQKMVELVQRGVQVNYYYPAHGGQHGASAYRGLRDLLRSTLDEQYHPLIHGFQVGLRGMRLFGWQTRYIIITRWNDQRDVQEVRDGFLYVVSAGTDEDHLPSDDTHECWLRMRLSVARDYYKALCDHAEPIVDLGIYS